MSPTTNRKFCASPWVEGVLSADGRLEPCCINHYSYGNWLTDGLQSAWRSDAAQQFRRDILDGRFPNADCRNCYARATHHLPTRILWEPFRQRWDGIGAWLDGFETVQVEARRSLRHLFEPSTFTEFWRSLRDRARAVFNKIDGDTESEGYFRLYAAVAEILDGRLGDAPPAAADPWRKIGRTLVALQSFLNGDLEPPVVAPFRQPNIIEVCNARCIYCPGHFSGVIVHGKTMPDGSRFKQMPLDQIETALACPEDILELMINGSEFLFHRNWRDVVQLLKAARLKLRISTNTINLTPPNIDYLIDHGVLADLNVSIDGATKATVESTRVNVSFDRMTANLRYLFERLGALHRQGKPYDVCVSFSYVLMKRNYQELPEVVRLVARLCEVEGLKRRPHVSVHSLHHYTHPKYAEMFVREHHSVIDRADLQRVVREMQAEANARGITVLFLNRGEINQFVAQGFPFPEHGAVCAAQPGHPPEPDSSPAAEPQVLPSGDQTIECLLVDIEQLRKQLIHCQDKIENISKRVQDLANAAA